MKRGPKGTQDVPIIDIIQRDEYVAHVKKYVKYKINIQQVAKEVPVMDTLIAGDGYFVQQDVVALEPTVLAEMSGNETYKEMYASGKPHDVYLYTAIKIMPWVGPEIDVVYNMKDPTKESVGAAKKKFKKERTQAKPIVLSGTYKAGVRKQYNMLKLQGANLDFGTVKEMHANFWGPQMFGQLLEWEKELEAEVSFNGGYILNGMGRPFVVLKHKLKDIQNIMGQSTGHCILDILNYHLSRIVIERQLNAHCKVEDWHDERIWWAPTEADAILLKLAMEDSLAALNEELCPEIPFKAPVEITKTFTGFKEPDPWLLT